MASLPCCDVTTYKAGALFLRRKAFSTGTALPAKSACRSKADRGTLQVCAAKGKSRMRQGYSSNVMPPAPPTPEPDPKNVEFVLFVRAKGGAKWLPLSIMNGGGAANSLVRSLDSGWGRTLFSNILIRSIAESLYQNKSKMDQDVIKNMPDMRTARSLEYGFKIRDKASPKDWYVANDITALPAKKQLQGTPLDNAKKFFGSAFAGKKA